MADDLFGESAGDFRVSGAGTGGVSTQAVQAPESTDVTGEALTAAGKFLEMGTKFGEQLYTDKIKDETAAASQQAVNAATDPEFFRQQFSDLAGMAPGARTKERFKLVAQTRRRQLKSQYPGFESEVDAGFSLALGGGSGSGLGGTAMVDYLARKEDEVYAAAVEFFPHLKANPDRAVAKMQEYQARRQAAVASGAYGDRQEFGSFIDQTYGRNIRETILTINDPSTTPEQLADIATSLQSYKASLEMETQQLFPQDRAAYKEFAVDPLINAIDSALKAQEAAVSEPDTARKMVEAENALAAARTEKQFREQYPVLSGQLDVMGAWGGIEAFAAVNAPFITSMTERTGEALNTFVPGKQRAAADLQQTTENAAEGNVDNPTKDTEIAAQRAGNPKYDISNPAHVTTAANDHAAIQNNYTSTSRESRDFYIQTYTNPKTADTLGAMPAGKAEELKAGAGAILTNIRTNIRSDLDAMARQKGLTLNYGYGGRVTVQGYEDMTVVDAQRIISEARGRGDIQSDRYKVAQFITRDLRKPASQLAAVENSRLYQEQQDNRVEGTAPVGEVESTELEAPQQTEQGTQLSRQQAREKVGELSEKVDFSELGKVESLTDLILTFNDGKPWNVEDEWQSFVDWVKSGATKSSGGQMGRGSQSDGPLEGSGTVEFLNTVGELEVTDTGEELFKEIAEREGSGDNVTDVPTGDFGMTKATKTALERKAGRELSDEEAAKFYISTTDKFFRDNMPNYDQASKEVRGMLIDLAYNVGVQNVPRFNGLMSAMAEGNFAEAARQTLDTANVSGKSVRGIAKRRAKLFNNVVPDDMKIASVEQLSDGTLRYLDSEGNEVFSYKARGGRHPKSAVGTLEV